MKLLGIDIGGTKTAVCVGDETGKVIATERVMMRDIDGLDAYKDTLNEMITRVTAEAGTPLESIDQVGISAPGPLNVQRGVLLEPPNNPTWKNVPIVDMVRDLTSRPVAFNNDGNACALAEYAFGTDPDRANMVYLTCSTGIGAGITSDGQLIQGAHDLGGEVGHHTLYPDGLPCGCGKRGCWEMYCGGRFLALDIQHDIRTRKLSTLMTELVDGKLEDINIQVLVEAKRKGDHYALKRWDQYITHLAMGIGNVLMFINPAVVVLGTIAVHLGDELLDPLRERIPDHCWRWSFEDTRIITSTLGADIGNLSALAVAASASGTND